MDSEEEKAENSSRLKDFGYALFGVLIAAFTLFFGFPRLSDVVSTTVAGEESTGRVVEVVRSCSQGCTYMATVSYSVAGEDYQSEMMVGSQVRRQDDVVVRYLPSDPATAVSSSWQEFWVGGLLTLMGVGALVGAGVFLWAGIRGEASYVSHAEPDD